MRPDRARTTRRAAVDVALALLVVLSSFAPTSRGEVPNGPHALPALALAAVVLLFRRRFPLPVLALTVVAGAASTLLGMTTPALALPVAFAIYTVARLRPRREALVLTAGLVVLLPAVQLIAAGAGFTAGTALAAETLQPAAAVALAAAIGLAVQAQRDALRAAEERADRAEESREAEAARRVAEDRLAIARDLHDSIAHRIAVVNLHAGVAARAVRSDPDAAERSLAVIGEAARDVIAETQTMLGLLRSTADAGRVDEPEYSRIEGLLGLFARSGLRVRLRRTGTPLPLEGAPGVVAYRVVQESLTNAYKHGDPREAELSFDERAESVVIRVENPLGGAAPASEGHGLTGMRERLAAVGGTLNAAPVGGRFVLEAVIPRGADAGADADADADAGIGSTNGSEGEQ